MAIPANQRQRLANMKMGEHMGRRSVAPQQKKNDGLLDKIGGAVSAVGDAASAAGSWVTGGATKEQLTSPAYYAKGLGNTVNDFVIQPAWRTASGQNVQTLFSPDASLNQRINAVGEDAINIASLFTGGAVGTAAKGMQIGTNSLARMMAGQGVRQAIRAGTKDVAEAAGRNLASRLTPSADLSTYLFHGGPKPENLVGGVLSPKYVRGGDEFAELYSYRGALPSVKSGPNQLERNSILQQFEDAKTFLSTPKPPKPAWQSRQDYVGDIKNKTKAAEDFIKEHEEIVRRIRAGEEHQTGLNRFSPGGTYHNLYGTEGGTHILDVPRNLQTSKTPAPAGEVKFWGDVKPSAFVPYVDNQPKSTTNALITQAMLDDADKKSMQSQRLANMLARVGGAKITPAYKEYVRDVLDNEFGTSFRGFTKNPRYGENAREVIEYYTDLRSPMRTPISNLDEVQSAISRAKTQDEIMAILDSMVPDEQLDIYLTQGMSPKGTYQELLQRIKKDLASLDSGYARFNK